MPFILSRIGAIGYFRDSELSNVETGFLGNGRICMYYMGLIVGMCVPMGINNDNTKLVNAHKVLDIQVCEKGGNESECPQEA